MLKERKGLKLWVILLIVSFFLVVGLSSLGFMYSGRGERFYYNRLSLKEKTMYLSLELRVRLGVSKVRLILPYSKEEVKKVMTVFLFENPELFNLSKKYGIISKRGRVSKIELNYLLDRREYRYMKKEVDDEVDKLVDRFKDMDDLEKSYMVYSYLAENTNYYKTGNFFNSMYGTMITNRANCEGMSSSYMYIMNKLGVPTWQALGEIEVDGALENHSWNISYIGGKYYYTDVTFASKHSSRESSKFYDYLNMSCERSLLERSTHFQNKIFGEYCFD